MNTILNESNGIGRLVETRCTTVQDRIRVSFAALRHPERIGHSSEAAKDQRFVAEESDLDRECLSALASDPGREGDSYLLAATLRANASLGRMGRLAGLAAEDVVAFPPSRETKRRDELDELSELMEALLATSIAAFEQMAPASAELVLMETDAVRERIDGFEQESRGELQQSGNVEGLFLLRSLKDRWEQMLEEAAAVCRMVLFVAQTKRSQNAA